MKKIAKMLAFLTCFALVFSFAACDTQSKADALAEVNAALAKTDSANAYDVSSENTMTMAGMTMSYSIDMKGINRTGEQKAYQKTTMLGTTTEMYYVNGYTCTPYGSSYVVIEADFENYFSSSNTSMQLSNSDVSSWSKSGSTYTFNLTSGDVLQMDEILGEFEGFEDVAVSTTKLEVTIAADGYVSKMKISMGITVEGIECSIVSSMTFNALGDAVAINVPAAVTAAINEYIGEEEPVGETLAQALAKINAALEKTDSETSYDATIETAMIMAGVTVTYGIDMKLINNDGVQKAYQKYTMFDEISEDYYVDGYVCSVYDGEYVVMDADFDDFFGTSGATSMELSASDVSSWSKSGSKYILNLTNSNVLDMDEVLEEFENISGLTTKLEVTIDGEGYVSNLKISLNFLAEGIQCSVVVNMTFNAFGDDVVINVPAAVAAAIIEFVMAQ